MDGDVETASHVDLEDENQTVYIPEIGTTAADVKTGTHHATAEKNMAIVDTVTYANLIPGKTYSVTGTLMDKETGKELLVNGKKITQTVEFIPENPSGSVEIQFQFDGSFLAGKTIVAWESLSYEGKTLAIHSDLNDEAQSIHVPDIHTTATGKKTGNHTAVEGKRVTIIDEIAYTNLIPGQKYKITGTLMDKKAAKPWRKTGSP